MANSNVAILGRHISPSVDVERSTGAVTLVINPAPGEGPYLVDVYVEFSNSFPFRERLPDPLVFPYRWTVPANLIEESSGLMVQFYYDLLVGLGENPERSVAVFVQN